MAKKERDRYSLVGDYLKYVYESTFRDITSEGLDVRVIHSESFPRDRILRFERMQHFNNARDHVVEFLHSFGFFGNTDVKSIPFVESMNSRSGSVSFCYPESYEYNVAHRVFITKEGKKVTFAEFNLATREPHCAAIIDGIYENIVKPNQSIIYTVGQGFADKNALLLPENVRLNGVPKLSARTP